MFNWIVNVEEQHLKIYVCKQMIYYSNNSIYYKSIAISLILYIFPE